MVAGIVGGTPATSVGGATTPALPAGMVNNEPVLLVDVIVRAAGSVPAPGAVAGFTEEATYVHPTTGRSRITLSWRTFQTGDVAPTVPLGGTTTAVHWSRLYRVQGGGAGNPTDVLGAGSAFGVIADIGPINGVTTGYDNGAVLVVGVREDSSSGAPTVVATLTGDSLTWVELDERTEATAGDDGFVAVGYALVPTARTITDKTFDVTSGSPASVESIGIMWALRPAGVAAAAGAATGSGAAHGATTESGTTSGAATGSGVAPAASAGVAASAETAAATGSAAMPSITTGAVVTAQPALAGAVAAQPTDVADYRLPYVPLLGDRSDDNGYDLVLAARVPQPAGPPLLYEVDSIPATSMTWTDELSAAQSLDAACEISRIPSEVRQRMKPRGAVPNELWLYRGSRLVFAGPLRGWRRDGPVLNLAAKGLLDYLRGWYVEVDLTFAQIDQLQIAAALVDHYQALDGGHHGIFTDQVGLSGRLRDATYLRAEEHQIGQRVTELGRRIDGFDVDVDPLSRRLRLSYPRQGIDRSVGEDAVVFDERNLGSPNAMCSFGPDAIASHAIGTGTSSTETGSLYAAKPNDELRARWGRTTVAGTWSDVSEQPTLDAHTQSLIDVRGDALVVPGPAARNVPDADLVTYGVGDTVSYRPTDEEFDVAGAFRLRKRSVVITGADESISVEFV